MLAISFSALPWLDRTGNHLLGESTPSAAAEPAASPPCAPTIRACADLSARYAWLRDREGRVIFGPVPLTAGSAEHPSPTGVYSVTRKSKDHVSAIYDTPMPFAVFFDDERGYAFHEGDLTRPSAGCLRLDRVAAERFFNELEVGDSVQIVP